MSKIKYTGIKKDQSKRSSGCPVCGAKKRRGSNVVSYEYTFKMVLPSGNRALFRLNQTYEIKNVQDYEFLKNFYYDFKGKKEYPFVAV